MTNVNPLLGDLWEESQVDETAEEGLVYKKN